MRILVTGAAGFIGSHLVDRLLGDGHEVVAVDTLVSGHRANLADSVELHEVDVADPAFTALAVKTEPEAICHLAAQVSVRVSVSDPLLDARTNVLGTINVLEAARTAGSRKTVFTSSCAVYGVPDSLPVGPDAPLRPRSPYAASKTTGETYMQAYRDLHGLDFTTLTLANVYGPRQTPEGEAGVISIFTAALLKGEPTIVFGDGSHTRDYVYVLDVVDAYARALAGGPSGRFNIGTGVQTSDRALHTLVARAAGAPDAPGSAPFRLGDLPAMALDPAPAREELGWRPTTALADGLEATVEWARSH
ncbi:UDP-glucose 4-epimerase [Actinocorallia herbida]|uniref:UDP-glucose 4-epimerase n=1 Tax=Actinocorallia herbida TaxID=58109 RepID=A0A3N1CPU0_9ACTN|nr:NAD-dependent epimerase/dehydratase family protein [Actinocorallia herbida]ROO83184.1 UDP-glucose 4-epimerase [Actinocorallia herbida]